MTRDEIVRLLTVATETKADRRRDYWLAHLGCCAGLRSQEILGLQGRHFARPGWIEVTEDLGKGAKARSIPVLKDLEPVVVEILTFTELDEYVLPGRTSLNPPEHTVHREHPHKRLSASALYKQTVALGERAGLSGRLTPHCLRRAFAEHVARSAGLRVAQALLGHASVETTTLYTERPSLDELAVTVQGFSFFYPASKEAQTHHDSTSADNERTRDAAKESGLPLALTIHEHGDQDSFVALPTVSGDTLILELDDGRTIEVDRKEILDRAEQVDGERGRRSGCGEGGGERAERREGPAHEGRRELPERQAGPPGPRRLG
jgi:hypothetical protein